MKKLLLLFVSASIMLTACTDTVEFPNGEKINIPDTIYDLGDSVCIQETTSIYGTSYSVSDTYWKDTVVCFTAYDTLPICWEYRMGVIIDK